MSIFLIITISRTLSQKNNCLFLNRFNKFFFIEADTQDDAKGAKTSNITTNAGNESNVNLDTTNANIEITNSDIDITNADVHVTNAEMDINSVGIDITNSDIDISNTDLDEVTSVNLPSDIDIMSYSGINMSQITTKHGEIVISGVPRPPPQKPVCYFVYYYILTTLCIYNFELLTKDQQLSY